MQHLSIKIPVLILLLYSVGSMWLVYPLMNHRPMFIAFLITQLVLLTLMLVNNKFNIDTYIFVNTILFLLLILTTVWVRFQIQMPLWLTILAASCVILLIMICMHIVKLTSDEDSIKTLSYGGISLFIITTLIVEFIRYTPGVYFLTSIIGLIVMIPSLMHDHSIFNKRSKYEQTAKSLAVNILVSFIICYMLILRLITTI